MTINQTLANVATDVIISNQLGKKWYTSKTLWVNLIASCSIGLQMKYGFIIDANMQALGLSIVNIILRKITKEAITF